MKESKHGRFAGRAFFLGLLLMQPLCARASDLVGDTVAELAGDRVWLKLLYYEANSDSPTGWESASVSDNFFVAEDGRRNPQNELAATLNAMSQPVGDDVNKHAQCRFPARYLWLKSQSKLTNVQDLTCPDFEEWIYGGQTDSISIIFVTGYLGNPASYYGHTLLKFNSSKSRETSDLLDTTVNYGAIIPPDVGPISYMYNGAVGGFNAGFSHIEYYFHDHNYGETELRDLWEYELNLSAEEVRLVLAHSWEVLGKEYIYYFFRRNCAYRMAEVIEIVDGIDLIPPRRGWTIPQSIITRTANTRIRGESLIRNTKYYPSRQSTFYEKFRSLSGSEKSVMRSIVRNSEDDDAWDDLGSLTVDSQSRVLDTSLDYYQYRMPNDESKQGNLKNQYTDLLVRRFTLPPAKATATAEPQRGPHQDRAPGYASFGFAHNDERGNSALIRIRPAYYDVLDSAVSHVPNSELSMAEVVLRTDDDRISISKASVFRVEAVNGSISGLPGDNGRSWALGLGFVEQSPACRDCLVARFEGDIGRSIPVGVNGIAGVYVGGAIQDGRNSEGNLFVRATGFINFTASDRLRMQARYESRYHLDGYLELEEVVSINARLVLSNNYDLRLTALRNQVTEVSIALGYYW